MKLLISIFLFSMALSPAIARESLTEMDKQQLTDLFLIYNSEWQFPIVGKFHSVGGDKSYFSEEDIWWVSGYFDFEDLVNNNQTCRDERVYFTADKVKDNWTFREVPDYTAYVYFKNKAYECDYLSGNGVKIYYPMSEQEFLERHNTSQAVLTETLKFANNLGLVFPQHVNISNFYLRSLSKPIESNDFKVEKMTFKQSNFLLLVEYKIDKQKIEILNLETGIN